MRLLPSLRKTPPRPVDAFSAREVYERAIAANSDRYRRARESTGKILFLKNRLESDVAERRAELARLHDDARKASRAGRDALAAAILTRRERLFEHLARAEQDLADLRADADLAKGALAEIGGDLRDIEAEKSHALTRLSTQEARRMIAEICKPGCGEDPRLAAVRAELERIDAERTLDRELGE